MIERIISEIRLGLTNKLYLSALALALTLPDTCGKAEYPNKGNGERYKSWCRKYVITDQRDTPYDYDMPYLNEEILYDLRNSLLHQSTPNISQSKIKEERCRVDKFELIASDDFITNGDLSMVAYGNGMRIVRRELQVNITHLCCIICEAAESYYKNNKCKFGFIKYSLKEETTYEGLQNRK